MRAPIPIFTNTLTAPVLADRAAAWEVWTIDQLRCRARGCCHAAPKPTTRPAQANAGVMTRIGVGRRQETCRRASYGIGRRRRGHRLEGREVIAVFEDCADPKASYIMWLEWRDGQVIHDYRYGL